jgi:hypothetical protein
LLGSQRLGRGRWLRSDESVRVLVVVIRLVVLDERLVAGRTGERRVPVEPAEVDGVPLERLIVLDVR